MADKRSTKDKLSKLIKAATTDDLKQVDALLAAGADASARDDRGLTLLMHAARATGHPRIVKRLLDAGADPAATDDHGWNALRYAQRREPSKAQQAIVGMLGGTEKRNEKVRKNHAIATGGTGGAGRRFFAWIGAQMRSWKPGQIAWFFIPIVAGGFSVVRSLLTGSWGVAGVKLLATLVLVPIVFFVNLLINRVAGRSVEPVASRARADAGDDEPDRTPLMAALENEPTPEEMRLLIEAGADVNERNKYMGQTVLMWAAVGCTDPAMFRVLLEAGARVDHADKEGTTALMLAAAVNENPEVIKVLIGAGADVNAVDEGGETVLGMALGRAEQKGRGEIIRMLKEAGAVQHLERRKGHPR